MIPLAALALAKIAPEIVGWIKGPRAQETAQRVTDVALALTGHDDPQEAAQFLAANPEIAAEFRSRMRELEVEELRLQLADMSDARAMQVAALAQGDVFSRRFAYYYAIGWAVFAMGYFAAVTFTDLPDRGIRFADTILGVLIGTVLTGIMSWLYGSTQRSAGKDVTIQALMRGAK